MTIQENERLLLEEIRKSPLGRELLDGVRARESALRQNLAAELVALASEDEQDASKRSREVEKLKAATAASRRRWEEDVLTLQAEERKWENRFQSRAFRRSIVEAELRESSDPKIAEAVSAMQERFDRARNDMYRAIERPARGINGQTGAPLTVSVSNERAIHRLVGAMVKARQEFEALRLEHPADLDAAIALVLQPVEVAWQRLEEYDDDPRAQK